MPNSINLFISYSHEDAKYKENIIKFLSPLTRSATIHHWDDDKIRLGKEWDNEIKEAFESSRIILLLISADFFDSEYIMEKELKWALEKHHDKDQNVSVIPIYIRECLLDENITKLQGIPGTDNPISSFEDKDKAYTLVAKKIASHVKELTDYDDDDYNARVIEFEKDHISSSKDELRNKNKIYLSVGSNSEERKAIFQELHYRREWENWDYEVIPNPGDAAKLETLEGEDLERAIRSQLDESLFSIHFIENEEVASSVLARTQYQLAKQRCSSSSFRCVVAINDSEAEKALFKEGDEDYNNNPSIEKKSDWNKTIIIDKIDKLLKENEERIKELEKRAEKIEEDHVDSVFLLYNAVDEYNQVRGDLIDDLEKEKVDVVPNIFDDYDKDDKNIREYEKEQVNECDGVVIFYANADNNWCKIRQDFVLKEKAKTRGVCVDEPDVKKKIRFDVRRNMFQLLNEDKKLKQDVKKFVRKLRA